MTTAHNALSYSDLQCFGRCPRQYYYRNIVRIQRKRPSLVLRLGQLIHSMFQEHNTGGIWADVGWKLLRELDETNELFSDEKLEMEEMIQTASDIVAGYLAFWHDTWEILHVEEQFIVKLDSGDVVSFTPDLVVRDGDGLVWVLDFKTTQNTPDSEEHFTDLQSLLYYAGVKSLYPEAAGFVFDYLRKKVPTEPRLALTGKQRVADLNRIDTTYEILRNFLESDAPELLDDLDHRRRLAELRDNPRFFYRHRILITDEQSSNALDDVVAQIKLVRFATEHDLWPRVYQKTGVASCSRCEMNAICQADLLGWDSEVVLESMYEPRDPKNVYESEED